eukprot:SAG22_NODE_4_length_44774_cov_362.122149_21_plen_115_part_00
MGSPRDGPKPLSAAAKAGGTAGSSGGAVVAEFDGVESTAELALLFMEAAADLDDKDMTGAGPVVWTGSGHTHGGGSVVTGGGDDGGGGSGDGGPEGVPPSPAFELRAVGASPRK